MFTSLHTEKLLVPELNNSFLLLQKWINFEIFFLLGYGTVSLGEYFLVFQRITMPSSSESSSQQFAQWCSVTSHRTYHQKHSCANVNSRRRKFAPLFGSLPPTTEAFFFNFWEEMYVETPVWVLICSMLVILVVSWYTVDYMTSGRQRQAGALCNKEIRTCNLINTIQGCQYDKEIGNFIRDCFKATNTYVWLLLTSHLILNSLTVFYMFVLLQ